MDRTGDSVDANAAGSHAELAAIDRIPIAEQMAWFLTSRCGLDNLPPHPGCGRVGRHIDVHQLTPVMGDEHQHVQCLERRRRDGQQIGGPEMVNMIAQERAPALRGSAPWSSPAIPPNRSIADNDAQLEQLASDALSAPQPVLAGHGRDQVPHLGADMKTAAASAGLPAPEQAPALAMPAHDRLWCDEGQMVAPVGAESASEDPQQLVPEAKPSTWSVSRRTSEHRELMAQEKVFERQLLVWAHRGSHGL
jgi:hypothetical protein